MLEFLIVFAVSVGLLLTVQAVDIECTQPAHRRRPARFALPRRRSLGAPSNAVAQAR